jgi:two-component sensor histidine kinase
MKAGLQGTVSARQLFTGLCRQLHRDAARLNLAPPSCHAPDLPLATDIATPLAFVIVEAVTNAYRHGLKGEATAGLTVRLRQHGDAWTLTITDQGHGFDATRPGSGLGLQLISLFAQQVGGTHQITSTPGLGTEVRIEFSSNDRDSHSNSAAGQGGNTPLGE